MEEKQLYTISIYSENNIGLLNRISAIFLKRHINIESFSTSPSEIKNVFRFVIVVQMTQTKIKKIVGQIEKQVDVIKAFYHTDEETIFQESALYKVKSSALFEERHIQNVIKESHANIVTVSPEFFVIEKTGFRHETEKLYNDLAPYGLLQFVFKESIDLHFLHLYAILFVLEVGLLLFVGWWRPRSDNRSGQTSKDAVSAGVPPVDMTPWRFARACSFSLLSCVVFLYLLFSPVGLAGSALASGTSLFNALVAILLGLNTVVWWRSVTAARVLRSSYL